MRKKVAETLIVSLLIGLALLYRHWFGSSTNENDDDMEADEKIAWWTLSPIWVEDQRPHINPHRFGILINNPELCREGEDVDLLIMVASAVKHEDRRHAIRQTWASELHRFKAKVIFLLGQGRDQQSKIQAESAVYQDIIQEDFEDTYHNLTLKTVMGLKWTSIFCPQSRFVLKTDDDIYVNIDLLHRALQQEYDVLSQHIHGCVKNSPLNSPQPIPKEGQPRVSMMKPALPQFTAGAGYLLPGGRIISDLYLASLASKIIPVEDAYTTGFCAKKIGLHPPVNDGRFSCGQLVNDDDCHMASLFTGHKVNPDRMLTMHDRLQRCD